MRPDGNTCGGGGRSTGNGGASAPGGTIRRLNESLHHWRWFA